MEPDRSDRTPFPTVVAWGSLLLAVLVFFGNAVPALRERADLRATRARLQELREQYDRALASAWASAPGHRGADDLQSVLVAIDQIGWTPEELLRSHPGDEIGPLVGAQGIGADGIGADGGADGAPAPPLGAPTATAPR